jgi:hypothetical protein
VIHPLSCGGAVPIRETPIPMSISAVRRVQSLPDGGERPAYLRSHETERPGRLKRKPQQAWKHCRGGINFVRGRRQNLKRCGPGLAQLVGAAFPRPAELLEVFGRWAVKIRQPQKCRKGNPKPLPFPELCICSFEHKRKKLQEVVGILGRPNQELPS